VGDRAAPPECCAPHESIRTPLIGAAADSLAPIHPLQRVGEVAETSDAVLYLVRAGFVTGSILDVDGGYAHGR
jgi:NAD(P)-dependent dehydrogenase (short-subunit alcohol dehydrogenase family)